MAENPANGIVWLLELPKEHADRLAGIRHWEHLKVAIAENSIWVSGFRKGEVDAAAVKSIPAMKIWRLTDGRLFPGSSLLPTRKAPSLTWTPIEQGLPLDLPPVSRKAAITPERIPVRLLRSDTQQQPAALLTSMDDLGSFIETAPAIRLATLSWVIMDYSQALILGTPLLPVPGQGLWRNGDFLLPDGYDFEWPVVTDAIRQLLHSEGTAYTLWQADGCWLNIPKDSFTPLSIGSYRQSRMLRKTIKGQIV